MLKGILWTSKIVALVSLFVAFPTLYAQSGKSYILSTLLILFTSYFTKGCLQVLTDFSHSSNLEFPVLTILSFFLALKCPHWLVKSFEYLLVVCEPLLMLLEGFSTVLVIVVSGQYFLENIQDESTSMKTGIFALCCGLLASSLIVMIHTMISSSVVEACMISSFITLLFVLGIFTVRSERGSFTSICLMFVYVSLNASLLNSSFPTESSRIAQLSMLLPFWSNGFVPSLIPFQLLSIAIYRLGIFLLACYYLADDETIGEDSIDNNLFLKYFGKSILILIFSSSWLSEGLSLYRWINCFVSISLYSFHLWRASNEDISFE